MTRLILLVLTAIVAFSEGFSPNHRPGHQPDTALRMGLFDAFMPQKKEPETKGGMDVNVFGGRGAKITIREDEDNAMWIDEDAKKDKKKGKKGK